jgi:hypothetical protein
MFSVRYEPNCGKFLEQKKVVIDGEVFSVVASIIYRTLQDNKNVNIMRYFLQFLQSVYIEVNGHTIQMRLIFC